jgi:hypothetical protein
MRAQTPFAYSPPPVAALGDEARIFLKAARMWVMLARSNRSPRPALAALLGPAAARFSLLMDIAVSAWPDAFTTFPPCACTLSPDEHSLLTLLALAEVEQDTEFHSWFADLLPQADRQRLWSAACRLMAERIGVGL